MKSVYVKPVMISEQFLPNEYVAACGESNKVYKFICDANSGGLFDGGYVYIESNGEPNLQRYGTNSDTFRSPYYPCSETHEAPTKDAFLDGYLVSLSGLKVTPVIVWTNNDTNTHCTTNIHMEKWETTKS